MSNTPEPKITRQMTLPEFDRLFPNETACKSYLVASRWPKGVTCPRCGNEKVWALKTRPFNWVCKKCGDTPYRFSVLVGTIFENTRLQAARMVQGPVPDVDQQERHQRPPNPPDDRFRFL